MRFSPPLIINIVIVISRRRNSCCIEIRIGTKSCCGHKTASGMPENSDFFYIDKRITVCQLLDTVFIVCQSIIPEIIVSISMIPFIPLRTSSSMAEVDNNKSDLCQGVIIHTGRTKIQSLCLCLRTGVHIRNNRVATGRIEIHRFPHDPV